MHVQMPRKWITVTRLNSSPDTSVVSVAGECTPALFCSVQLPELGNDPVDRCGHGGLVDDVAPDCDRLMAIPNELFSGRATQIHFTETGVEFDASRAERRRNAVIAMDPSTCRNPTARSVSNTTRRGSPAPMMKPAWFSSATASA